MADDVLKGALERFRISQDASSEIRADAKADVEFARLGKQWPDAVKKLREDEGRPVLTINRLPSFIRQVVNDARQNSPSINVVPVDNGADPDTAEVIGGLIRSIERGSNAAIAYDTALEHAVDRGFGFFRITTDYCHSESFDMEARIERVSNPFSVHWDTNTTQFDASDWEYCFVSDMLTEREFKAKYPKAKPVSFEAPDENEQDWTGEAKVRVAEYWLRSEVKRKIVLLSDGRVVRADALAGPIELAPGLTLPMSEALAMAGVSPVREREATAHEVKRRVITGVEVLEETDWVGSMIPVVPVWGEEVIHEGKRAFRSLVRDAKDPQTMFNFWRSATTELVALAPRAPWLVPHGGIPRGEERKWESANTRSHAYLTYDAKAGPMPQRTPFAGVPAGALQEALNASDDMKAIMGIYDAALGARSNETSGRAIMARQRESDTGTFHFIDNLSRAVQYAGRVLVEIIPGVYSQRQAIQILGSDEQAKVVRLGKGAQPGAEGERLYDLSVGKYDVAVKTGPSFTTQREETRQALIEIAQAAPDAAAVIADVVVGSMDFPNAADVAKRLKAMLPPQVLAAEGEKNPEVAALKQQNQAMQGQLQQAQAEVQSKQAETAIKQQELQLKAAELQLKREEMQVRAQLEMAKAHAQAMAPSRAPGLPPA